MHNNDVGTHRPRQASAGYHLADFMAVPVAKQR